MQSADIANAIKDRLARLCSPWRFRTLGQYSATIVHQGQDYHIERRGDVWHVMELPQGTFCPWMTRLMNGQERDGDGNTATDWIPWSGGRCPVEPNATVEVKTKLGGPYVGDAGSWKWDWMPGGGDIVAYRVVG